METHRVGATKIVKRRCYCLICGGYGVEYKDKFIWDGAKWVEYDWLRDYFMPWVKSHLHRIDKR